MIIVSQDKKKIINFDNIQYINIFKNQLYAGNIPNNKLGDFDTLLGEYTTEERAKEVLEEISDWYGLKNLGEMDCMSGIAYTLARRTSIYTMPED